MVLLLKKKQSCIQGKFSCGRRNSQVKADTIASPASHNAAHAAHSTRMPDSDCVAHDLLVAAVVDNFHLASRSNSRSSSPLSFL